jgi:kanamycin kinase
VREPPQFLGYSPESNGIESELPEAICALAAEAGLAGGRVVWVNELGGVTVEFETPSGSQFLKWAPHHPELDLQREASKLRWAGRYMRLAEVIDHGSDAAGTWLRTVGLPGESAVSARWRQDPRTAARVIGAGLRTLHERLPVADCPFSWSIEERLTRIKDPADSWLADHRPPIDRLVVCHGDACAPNTLLDDRGDFLAVVDLGELGVADRWADLAIATYSLNWNYPGSWEDELLDAYGIERDEPRITFYRQLWDAT